MRLYKNQLFVSSLFLLSILCACAQRNVYAHEAHLSELPVDTVSVNVSILGTPKNGIINISDTIDLNHRACTIPAGIILNFKGGVIKNGTLVGNMTQVKSSRACFSRLRIQGTWNVPVIKSSYFCDLNYDNSLKDVMALSNPAVKNKVVIEKGVYQVSAFKNHDVCVPVCSNTELIVNGTIVLTPNQLLSYNIIRAKGFNIKIHGNGAVVGDKQSHLVESGEWGTGIDIDSCNHMSVYGLTIKDCWGDCIYIGGKSNDVTIEGCILDNGRRQGISITSANDVVVKNCSIKNVSGTNPQYAIDVEPNKGEIVDMVTIQKVSTENCVGGFLAYGRAEGAKIGSITIRDCNVSSIDRTTIHMEKCDKVTIERCNIIQPKEKRIIYCLSVNNVIIQRNRLMYDRNIIKGIKGVAREKLGKELGYITISGSKIKNVRNNIEQ